MSLSIEDKSSGQVSMKNFTSEEVKAALKSGNETYKARDKRFLTEEEMLDLLSYLKKKNMRLIPGFNSPGHMNVILRAMEILKIPSPHFVNEGQKSETTVDLNNELAISFTKALFSKYVDFFADKVDAFNLGADEYAIHLKQGERHLGGFDVLQEKGLFTKFVTYVNDLAKIIKAKGLVPMAFNDGFYYNQDQTAFDKDIIVAYWQAPGGTNKGANALEISKKVIKYSIPTPIGTSFWVRLVIGVDILMPKKPRKICKARNLPTFMASRMKMEAFLSLAV